MPCARCDGTRDSRHRRRPDARTRHRCQHRDLQRRERCAAAPVARPRSGTTRVYRLDLSNDTIGALSGLEIDYLRRNATPLAAVTTYRTSERNLGSNQGERQAFAAFAFSPAFFDAIGTAPTIGRGFAGEEEGPGGPAVVVLSDALWRTAFAADRAVIGKQIRLDDSSFTVVGVLPADFRVPGESPAGVEFIVPSRLVIDLAEKGTTISRSLA